jgi:Co/Zn/Cd efflux system component
MPAADTCAPGGAGADRRYLLIALGLLGAFMLGEVITAVLSGSLALLSDAGHMLSDVGAIAAALGPSGWPPAPPPGPGPSAGNARRSCPPPGTASRCSWCRG